MSFNLRPYQNKAVADLRASLASGHRAPLLVAPCGSGKCLGVDTPVLMADGTTKKVQDVLPGQQLLGPDGKPRNVLSVCSGREMLYRVTPIKGDPYVVNSSHILSLKSLHPRHILTLFDGTIVREHEDIVNVNVEVFAKSNKTARWCLKGWRSDAIEDFHGGDMSAARVLPPYILGAWLGDGTARLAAISKPPCAMVDEWVAYGTSLGYSIREIKSDSSPCPTWFITEGRDRGGRKNIVLENLRALDVISNKHVPDCYKFGPMSVRMEVIAGMIDSDGHIHKGGCDWICKDQRMAEDFAFLCRSVGLSCYLSQQRKGIASTGFSALYWRASVSGDLSKLPMRDKKAEPRKQIKRHLVSGIEVEPIGEGDYYGFEIDGDRLFLLGDFTVTHNTVILAEVIRSAQAKQKKVLFLAPRRELIHQTIEKLEMCGVRPGIIMAGDHRGRHSDVQVGCTPSVLSLEKRHGLPKFDLVLQDESHIAFAGEGGKLLERLNAPRLGFTATPCNAMGLGLGMIYDDLILGPSVSELTDLGHLVPVRYFAPSEPDLKGIKVTAGDYNQAQLGARMDQPQLIGDVIENWLRIAKDQKTIVACVTVAHSIHMRDSFREVGIRAEHIDGTTPNEERAELFRAFRRGDFQVLCNCQITTYGYDEPSATCMVLAKPTKSLAVYLQIAGRILRPFDGKEHATLIDHAGAVANLGFVDDTFPWSLDGKENIKERQEKEKKEPKPITCRECKSVFKPQRNCPVCGLDCSTQHGKAVAAVKADLVEIERGQKKKASKEFTMEQKNRFYRELQYVAAEKRYKPSYADAVYRERFGVWCSDKGGAPIPPSPETQSWLKYLNIKRAKQREAQQRNESNAAH
ncbi:DEAD/DEAH box helicase family protein [Sphingomonas sp.]|jgi:superfamily II DNA or RNA helicase/uncharacterized protein YlzI (FlbEa/FlbD family)|uniref:DEAD/DEAH box helicase family protein n=1 Tax=Sphingomonas sp. TaxID=28214 RepID=UPI003562791E